MNSLAPVTLLIVDDEQEIRTGLRSIIPWEQYSISVIGTSANGFDALNQIRYYEPDIVITDIQMPGMDGLELVRRAKQEQFHCSFVILSGYDDFQYAKTAIRYGVSDYLLKPISIRELTDLVQKLTEEILLKRSYQTDQLSTLSKLRHAQISLRQYNLIPQLLHSELSAAELEHAIQDFSLPVRNQECCTVLIKAFSTRHDEEDFLNLNQTLTPLKNDLEQQLGQSRIIISELPSDGLLLTLNLPFQFPGGRTLQQILEQSIFLHTPSNHIHVTAAIGCSVPTLLDLAASYQSARKLITWHIYPELGNILETDLLKIEPPAILMPDDTIWESVLKNDASLIQTHFHQYFQQLLVSPLPPPAYIYSMCNYLIISIQNQIFQYLNSRPSFISDTYATLQNLSSIEDIESWMCETLSMLASELQVSRATQNDPLIEKAISYIQENLLNNPRTEDVCRYLGLSKSYFSTYFKNKTKITFREYTLSLKVTYAQEQLKHPERSPTEVALLLGYEDYSSFSRAFKARTGFSPSDYQSQYTAAERIAYEKPV